MSARSLAEPRRHVVVRSGGEVALDEHEDPALGPLDIRVRVAYSGICGSELHVLRHPEAIASPLRLGHEFSGIVEAVGEQVTSLRAGTPVACRPRIPCLRCPPCRAGRLVHCEAFIRLAHGAWADSVTLLDRFAVPLAPSASLRDAALAEPVACCLRGIDRAAPGSGFSAVVLGGGPIGLLTALLALRAGAVQVIVSEPSPERRALATALGAVALDPVRDDLASAVADATGGSGVDVAFEAVGSAVLVAEAARLVARGGTVVVLGLAPPGEIAGLEAREIFWRELSIVGAWGIETTFTRALALLPALGADRIVTHELPLERAAEGVALALGGACGKVLLAAGDQVQVPSSGARQSP